MNKKSLLLPTVAAAIFVFASLQSTQSQTPTPPPNKADAEMRPALSAQANPTSSVPIAVPKEGAVIGGGLVQPGGLPGLAPERGYEVHGYVVVKVRGKESPVAGVGGGSAQILVPDIEVYLRNIKTGQESEPVKSDLLGYFRFPPQAPGSYELRWREQAGWAAGLFPKTVTVRGNADYPGTIELQPVKGTAVVVGRVHLADGSTPWFYNEFFGLSRTATVSAAATNGQATGSVRTNFQGEFAIAGLSSAVDLKLTAASQSSLASLAIPAATLRNLGAPANLDLAFKNARPRLSAVVARLNGQLVTSAAPGSVLDVTADVNDPDGDPLTFDWRTQAGTVSGQGATVKWTLPPGAGLFELDVLVSDGKGGDVLGKVVIGSGATGVVFSGQVLNPAGQPVAGAAVSLGNQPPVATDRAGAFRLQTKEDRQYVLNIKADGFALLSRLTDRPLVGQTFRLVPAQVQKVDASGVINLTDRRPELERQKLRGGSVSVPAGALVDGSGNKASGALQAEIATLNIANDEMPGDFIGQANGADVGLISYGAMHVEFTDAAGKKCQLAAGAQADVTIPVPASMLAQAASTIPVWSYDPADGRWKSSGKATLDKVAGVYRGKVNHFSTINMDQTGPVSCFRIHTDVSLPAGLTLRVRDVPGEGVEFAQQKEMVLDGELDTAHGPLNAVYRCPANSRVQFLFKDRTGASLDQYIIVEDGDTRLVAPTAGLPGNKVTAGPASATLWPAYPYTGCKEVTIKLKTVWGGYPSSPFFSFKGNGTAAKAGAYYDAIDPLHNRTTLAQWFAQNGFDATGEAPAGPDYARTSYLNDNDLGSGRDMHFLKHADGTLSAYVTNYSRGVAFDQRLAFADDAQNKSQPGATVCMEYKPVEGATGAFAGRPIVKFFVYADLDGLPGIERQAAANLDGFGGKFVPNLCTNCHGGTYANPASPSLAQVDMACSFRELDLATYKFPGGRLVPNAAEQAAFRKQNLMIHDIAAAVPVGANPVARGPIRDLINGWYGGANQDNTYTPPAWLGAPQQNLYHQVVAVSCRTCHIAFDSADDSTGRDWNRYDQMIDDHDLINFYARGSTLSGTGSGRLMPHALVTYRNFWLQQTPVHRPTTLWNYSDGANWAAFGPPAP